VLFIVKLLLAVVDISFASAVSICRK